MLYSYFILFQLLKKMVVLIPRVNPIYFSAFSVLVKKGFSRFSTSPIYFSYLPRQGKF